MGECIYCGCKDPSKFNYEHIIPNKIGGKLKCNTFCCSECNRILGNDDNKFCDIFGGIRRFIPSFEMDRKVNDVTYFYAVCKHNNKKYLICDSNKKLTCKDYSREFKTNFNKNTYIENFRYLGNEFNLNNDIFKNGIKKIAMNFLLYCGCDYKYAKAMFSKNKTSIEWEKLNIFPFVWDGIYKDFESEKFFPYHQLGLFNIDNFLYCYIALFNTFQFYILISNEYDGKPINRWYSQFVQKRCYLDSLKYKVMEHGSIDFASYLKENFNDKYSIFIDTNNKISSFYRQKIIINGKEINFPCCCAFLSLKSHEIVKNYTYFKFYQLEEYLVNSNAKIKTNSNDLK